MGLTKSKGNMYPWVTHTHTHLAGRCQNYCMYCYVQTMAKRFNSEKYIGQPRLLHEELNVSYGKGKVIFIEHCNDLFAEDVEAEWINLILQHCCHYPDNTYVLQTKNPKRMLQWRNAMPPKRILGCTIETSSTKISQHVSKAPVPVERFDAMKKLEALKEETFITIEPILSGDPEELAHWCKLAGVKFVNVGADSKGTGLSEPTQREVIHLLNCIRHHGIEIKVKHNLNRLLKGD